MGCVCEPTEKEQQQEMIGYLMKTWTYEGIRGPDHWKEWFEDARGPEQSPIDLLTSPVLKKVARVTTMYQKLIRVQACHTGRTIEWIPEEKACFLLFGDEYYDLSSFHIHIPCEHTVNGAFNEMELQFVHESDRGLFAIISVLYRIGKPCSLLEALCHPDRIPFCEQQDSKRILVDMSNARLAGTCFHYRGSLTRPPCTEGVQWFILKEFRTLSENQFHLLLSFLPRIPNSRPVQVMNVNRKVWEVEMKTQAADETWHPETEISSGTYGFRSISSQQTDGPDYRIRLDEEKKQEAEESSGSSIISSITPLRVPVYPSLDVVKGSGSYSKRSRSRPASMWAPGKWDLYTPRKASNTVARQSLASSFRSSYCSNCSRFSTATAASVYISARTSAVSEEKSTEEEATFWNYSREFGPEKWDDMFPEACGNYQSPVEIHLEKAFQARRGPQRCRTSALGGSKEFMKRTLVSNEKQRSQNSIHYQLGTVVGSNDGRLVSWTIKTSAGFAKFDGKKCALKSIVVHTPAEHIVDGMRGCLELQLYHMDAKGKKYVLAIIFEEGDKQDKFLAKLADLLPQLPGEQRVGMICPALLTTTGSYCSYAGSMTTPPCSEGYKWHVNCTFQSTTRSQRKLFRDCVPLNNVRTPNALNGRILEEVVIGSLIE